MDWSSGYRYYLFFPEQSPILSLRSCTRSGRGGRRLLSTLPPSLSLSAFSSREISGSLTPENESFPGKYFFFSLTPLLGRGPLPERFEIQGERAVLSRNISWNESRKAALTRGLVVRRIHLVVKSRTRLSRSRSIRDAVELISIEWNDGNENTERERERGGRTPIRFQNVRARDRCPRSKVHGCARAHPTPTSGEPPAAYL